MEFISSLLSGPSTVLESIVLGPASVLQVLSCSDEDATVHKRHRSNADGETDSDADTLSLTSNNNPSLSSVSGSWLFAYLAKTQDSYQSTKSLC